MLSASHKRIFHPIVLQYLSGHIFTEIPMFLRPPPPSNWFSSEPIQDEVRRIESLDVSDDEKDQLISNLESKIKEIKSIKSVEISRSGPFRRFSANVKPRVGNLPTSIGGEAGTKQSVHVSTGYSNFFYSNEYVEVMAKIRTDSAPKFTMRFTRDDLNNADFSLQNGPYTTSSLSIVYDINMFKKQKISTASISGMYQKKGSKLMHTASMEMVQEDHSINAPPALYFDPPIYFKALLRTENTGIIPSLSAFSEIACVVAKKMLIPFLKMRTNFSKTFSFCNLKVLKGDVTGGAILAPAAVPFAEKFKIGGVPIARGIENDEFGPKVAFFPSGCDAFLSSTLEFFTPVFPAQNLNAHFFVNGAIASNFKSNNIFDIQPSFSSMVTFGTGFIFQQGPVQVELNAQLPFHLSDGQKCLRYQIGFTSV